MKTNVNVLYNPKEYSHEEAKQIGERIKNRVPAIDIRPGLIIKNKTVLFQVRNVIIDLEEQKKTIEVQQLTSRGVLQN